MRKLILTTTLAVIFGTSCTTNRKPTIESRDDSDLLLIEKYADLGMEWINEDLDSAKYYADLALELSEKNDSHYLFDIHAIYLYWNFYRGDLIESINTAHTLYELTDKENNEAMSAAFNNLGLMYVMNDEYDIAQAYYDSSLYFLLLGDNNLQGQIDLYNNMGILEKSRGDTEAAIAKYFEALELFDAKADPANAASLYQNLADAYSFIDDYNNALKYGKLATQYKTELKMNNVLGSSLTTLGDIYLGLANFDSSETYYLKALENDRQLGNKHGEGIALQGLANLGLESNDLNSALKYGLEAEALKRDYGTENEHLNSRYLLATVYYDLDRTEEANREFDSVEARAKELDNKYLLRHIYQQQSRIKERLGMLEKALEYERNAFAVSQELNNEERINAIAKMENLYENKLKTAEITALTAERKLVEANLNRHRLYLILACISAILLVTLIIALTRRMKHRKKLHKKEKLALEKEIELTTLKSMMNGEEQERTRIAKDLHDGLSGQLSAVKMKLSVVEHQTEELKSNSNFKFALETLNNAGKEVRRIAHNMAPQLLDQFGLVEALENYLGGLNGIDGVNINYVHSGFTNPVGRKIGRELFLIVQEVVNNAIKHAEASNISVSLTKSNAGIKLKIEDDGIGFDIKNLKPQGMGIRNLHDRVKTLAGDIQIDTQPNQGTVIRIEVLPRLEIAI